MKTCLKFLAFLSVTLSTSFAEEQLTAEAKRREGQLASQIVTVLEKYHYNHLQLDNDISKKIFVKVFKALDSEKKFFLLKDYTRFKAWELTLDDGIERGDLTFVYKLRDIYVKRVKERIARLPELLKRPMDFTKKEKFELDGDKKDFVRTTDELNDRWFKLLTFQVLSRKIVKDRANKHVEKKKSPEQIIKEIHEQLLKRYERVERFALKTRAPKMVDFFVDTVAEVFDPHSTHFSPSEVANFNIQMKLKFEGIGAALQSRDGYTKVVRIIPGGPAERDGRLQPEDLILEVAQGEKESTNVVGMDLDEVVQLIRGKKNTIVKLTVKPANAADESARRIIDIKRDEVKLEEQSAKSAVFDIEANGKTSRFGFIKLPSFYRDFSSKGPNTRSSATDVAKLVEKLKKDKVDGMIIDLRGNGGGSLPDSIKMAGLFIEDGPIVQVRNRAGKVVEEKDPDPSVHYSGPLLVMIDQFSASASEIFAAAMQDYGRAIIVGNPRTHGKGTVQTTIDLDRFRFSKTGDKLGMVKLTISKFYRVSGGSTQLKGVAPDIILPGLYDNIKIGEAEYEFGLPWDEIPPAKFARFSERFPLTGLRNRSQSRLKNENRFKNVLQRQAIITRNRNETLVSLNEEEVLNKNKADRKVTLAANRLQRRWQLKQKIISQEQFDKWEKRDANAEDIDPEELEHEQIQFRENLRKLPESERDAWEARSWRDYMVEEALNILSDFVNQTREG
jgi:carboxyl-terminal processing protease